MDKVKITEIKEHRKIKRKEKNSAGEWVEIEKTVITYREFPYVTGWLRFGHYIIDFIAINIFSAVFGVLLGFILIMTDSMYLMDDPVTKLLINILSWLIITPGYYIVFEGSVQRTLGKFITGTIVVDEYGEKPSFKQIIGRSYARVVPFEALSCFGTLGWHDSWSDTMIIKTKDLEELKTLVKLEHYVAEPVIHY